MVKEGERRKLVLKINFMKNLQTKQNKKIGNANLHV